MKVQNPMPSAISLSEAATARLTRRTSFSRWRALAALLPCLLGGLISVAAAAEEPVLWDGLSTPLFTHLGIPRDLPSVAMAIAQDKTGMIWIATEGGLARWD